MSLGEGLKGGGELATSVDGRYGERGREDGRPKQLGSGLDEGSELVGGCMYHTFRQCGW